MSLGPEAVTPLGGAQVVTGYANGQAFDLQVMEVECGHFMRADLVPQVQAAICAGREAGMTISISSAWRSNDKQTALWLGWKAGEPGFNPADPPGYSKHQDGTAIDLAFASGAEREEFAALAEAHGLTRPTPERWHFVAGHLTPSPIPTT